MSLLNARSLFSGASCSTPKDLLEYDEPFIGSLSFHAFNMYLSGACTFVVSVLCTTLLAEHACHLSNPSEQVKIMRIIHMLPAYTGLSYLAICWPNLYVYVDGWTEYFQALALYAFLLLQLDFLAPTDREKFEFFGSLKVPKVFKKGKYREGVSWLKLTFYCVIQYPIVVTICAIAQCVTQAFDVYCLSSDSPRFGHIWIEVFSNVSVTFAINAILRFYQVCKGYMKERHPLRKLLAFKLLVGLIFVEQIAFMVLESTDLLKQSSKISYADIHIGLPNMIICVQMVPFALLMRWAYPAKEYKLNSYTEKPNGDSGVTRYGQPRSYQGGRFGYRAWLSYLNIFSIWADGVAMMKLLREVHVRGQTLDSWPEAGEELTKPNSNNIAIDQDSLPQTMQIDATHSQPLLEPAYSTSPRVSSQQPPQPEWQPTSHQGQPMMPYAQQTTAYDPYGQQQTNMHNNTTYTGHDYTSSNTGQRYYS